MSLEDLLKRVAESSRSDRELDGLLYGMARHLTPRDTFITIDNFQFVHPDDDAKSYYVHVCAVPAYTSSLDAALALVEEKLPGWTWEVGISPACAHLGEADRFVAHLRTPRGELIGGAHGFMESGISAPLAVLAALLRALISQKEGVE